MNLQAHFMLSGKGCYCREPVRTREEVPAMAQSLANRLGEAVTVNLEDWDDYSGRGDTKLGPYYPKGRVLSGC